MSMKVLDLCCASGHGFEGWFASEDDFQGQLARGLVSCPVCADLSIVKRPSAPRLNLRSAQASSSSVVAPSQRPVASRTADVQAGARLAWLRDMVARTEDVGASFAEEARRIHEGEAPERAIRGQTTVKEAVALIEEGIPVLPLPMDDALKNPVQ